LVTVVLQVISSLAVSAVRNAKGGWILDGGSHDHLLVNAFELPWPLAWRYLVHEILALGSQSRDAAGTSGSSSCKGKKGKHAQPGDWRAH